MRKVDVRAVVDVRRSGRVLVWAKNKDSATPYSLYTAGICGNKISFTRSLRFKDLEHPSINEDARKHFLELDSLEEPLPEIHPAELAELFYSTLTKGEKALPPECYSCTLLNPRFCGPVGNGVVVFNFMG